LIGESVEMETRRSRVRPSLFSDRAVPPRAFQAVEAHAVHVSHWIDHPTIAGGAGAVEAAGRPRR